MREVRLQYFVILILAILPFLSIFLTSNLPHTSDGEVQIPRMAAFYKAVRDGHIPVRWAGELNYGNGMPLFNFMYHTPFYVSTLLIALGVSLVTSFKILLALSFILSGIFMLLFTREFFRDDQKALFVTILYQFAPYHLIDILTRGTIGTIYVYAFFPLVLWGITKIAHRKKEPVIFPTLITGTALAFMILSHNSLALVFFAIILLFIFSFVPSHQKKLFCFLGLFLGLSVSAFYWIPALVEHKYTYGDLFMKDLFRVNFPPLVNFFIPNPLNRPELRVSEVALHWGIVHSLAFLAGLLLIFRTHRLRDETKRIVLFSFVLIAGSIFFMHPVSSPLWERISFLRQFQFPWRLLSVILFATSMLGATLFEFKRFAQNRIFTFFLLLTVIATMFYWQPTQGYDHNTNEQDFWDYPLNTTYFGETDVIWSAGPSNGYPDLRVEVIEGNAEVHNFVKKNHYQTFTAVAKTPTRLVSHTQYFPGWRVYIDNVKAPIQFQDQNWRGLVTFIVPEGTHSVRIAFEETPVRLISDIISLGSIILIATAGFLWFRKKHT